MLVALSSHEDLVITRYVPRLAKPHLLAAAALGIAITSATSTQNLKEPPFGDPARIALDSGAWAP